MQHTHTTGHCPEEKIMIVDDKRTREQRMTHTVLITATDKFMSGWGQAEGGNSKAAWCCLPKHADAVFAWVSSRKEMKRVNENKASWRPAPASTAHVSYYVVEDNHPALGAR